jgi:UDP-glucose 4-epimerase
MKTVLVTGAAGLIGSEVCKNLIAKNFKVIACDNFSIGDWKSSDSNIQWENLDINSPNLEATIDKYPVDALIHCAAHPGGKSLAEPVANVEVNALGSMKLFNWCAKKKVEVIYLSSSAVYGPGHDHHGLKESDSLNPGTIYAVNKVACENYLKILGEGYGLKWSVLRLFATYGNGHKANTYQGIVNVLLTQLLTGNGDRVVVKGPLERVRGLIYVKDAAEAIVQTLMSSESRGEIINISHPEEASISTILNQLIKILEKKNVEIVVEKGTVGDPLYNYADCTKAKKFLNFQPRYSLDQGLRELIQDRLKQG